MARAKRAQPKTPPFPTETPQGVGGPIGNPTTKTSATGLAGAQAAEKSVPSAPPPHPPSSYGMITTERGGRQDTHTWFGHHVEVVGRGGPWPAERV